LLFKNKKPEQGIRLRAGVGALR